MSGIQPPLAWISCEQCLVFAAKVETQVLQPNLANTRAADVGACVYDIGV